MDFGSAVGAGVSGGLGIISSGLNYLFNKKLSEQQNQYNIDMWRMNNEYNSPQAQMQRFQEAGLNPNLIYGQGSAGNSSAPPQQVTPHAPEFSKEAQRLGEAFNIEQLKTLVANRKRAEAEADNARTNATRNDRQLFAEANFGRKWTYNYKKGRYELRPDDGNGEVTVVHPSAYYFNRILESNYNRAALIPYRANLLQSQNAYLVPQIGMQQYELQHYPASFWIGQGARAIHGVSEAIGTFMPNKWIMNLGRRGGAYRAPNGKIYYY